VQDQLALRDRAIKAGLIFRWRALQFEPKWPADLLIYKPSARLIAFGPAWKARMSSSEAARDRYRVALLV
jgi:hypothetical protein